MIYFISDIHLGAKYILNPRQHEQRVVDFLDTIASDATELYLLGDILDYWFEYRNVVPRGYVRFFGALARLADRGVKIVWLTGNHDIWLYDYLRDEIGIEVVDAPYIVREIDGKQFILAHGDRIVRGKASFRFICRLFRCRICCKLYSAIHPRWTIPFAHWWSGSSRGSNAADNTMGIDKSVEKIAQEVEQLPLDDIKPDFVVMGHYHIAVDTGLPHHTARLVMLGDWFDRTTYARFDGKVLSLKEIK